MAPDKSVQVMDCVALPAALVQVPTEDGTPPGITLPCTEPAQAQVLAAAFATGSWPTTPNKSDPTMESNIKALLLFDDEDLAPFDM